MHKTVVHKRFSLEISLVIKLTLFIIFKNRNFFILGKNVEKNTS